MPYVPDIVQHTGGVQGAHLLPPLRRLARYHFHASPESFGCGCWSLVTPLWVEVHLCPAVVFLPPSISCFTTHAVQVDHVDQWELRGLKYVSVEMMDEVDYKMQEAPGNPDVVCKLCNRDS